MTGIKLPVAVRKYTKAERLLQFVLFFNFKVRHNRCVSYN